MRVIESPNWNDWPVASLGPQRYGHFVLLRIDTKASFAELNDEEASRAAATLPQDWFLGIIMADGLQDAYNPDGSAKLNFRFSLVGYGLPDPPHASVPISLDDQAGKSHPPIALDSDLPWSELYVHTQSPAAGLVSRLRYGGDCMASLSQEDLDKLAEFIAIDNVEPCHLDDEQLDPAHFEAESLDEPSLTAPEYDSGSDYGDFYYDMFNKFRRLPLHFELSFDLEAWPALPADPIDFEEMVYHLEGIWDAGRERMDRDAQVQRPLDKAGWIQGVDDTQPADRDEEKRDAAGYPDTLIDLDGEADTRKDAVVDNEQSCLSLIATKTVRRTTGLSGCNIFSRVSMNDLDGLVFADMAVARG